MDINISRLAQEFESRITQSLNIMQLHFFDVCVDADPIALMSVKVYDGGSDMNIEEVANVAKMDDRTFAFWALDEGDSLDGVAEGIGKAHPEFIIENRGCRKSEESDEIIPILLATVPYVNKERRDVLVKAVGTYKDAFNTYVDVEANLTKVKMTPHLLEATDKDRETVEKLFKDKAKEYKDMAEQAAGDKIKKIEEAYQKWLEEKAASDSNLKDIAASSNPEAATSMSMDME